MHNTITPERPSYWCRCCHFGMRVKTALLCNKSTFLVPTLLFSSFIAISGYGFYIMITKLIKDDFEKPTSVTKPLFIIAFIIMIIIYAALSRPVYRMFKKYLVSKTKLVGRQKDNFDKNRDIPIHFILLNIDKDVPDSSKLMDIQKNVIQNLKNIINEISEKMCITTELLFTGSSAERFNIPVSSLHINSTFVEDEHVQRTLITDYDIMIGDKYLDTSFDSGKDYMIDYSGRDISPGYTRIYCSTTRTLISAKAYRNQMHTIIASMDISRFPGLREHHACWYCCLRCHYQDLAVFECRKQGPTVRIGFEKNREQYFFMDLTYCLQCKEWPHLSDWPSRPNRLWPGTEDVERVKHLGCHLVPKSQPNDKQGVTWRFSFSKAEVELSKLINPTSRRCFIALKVIGQDFIYPYCSGLKSYHLKTIFLNMLEKTPPDFWCDEKIEECFYLLLDHVTQAIETRICPHYWLYGINLFDKLTEKEVIKVLKMCNYVKKNPSHYIECFSFHAGNT